MEVDGSTGFPYIFSHGRVKRLAQAIFLEHLVGLRVFLDKRIGN